MPEAHDFRPGCPEDSIRSQIARWGGKHGPSGAEVEAALELASQALLPLEARLQANAAATELRDANRKHTGAELAEQQRLVSVVSSLRAAITELRGLMLGRPEDGAHILALGFVRPATPG